jgi:uncharacterized DUF497 family protein
MNYEWDERKRTVNLEKHGLDLTDAWKVFESSEKVTFPALRTELAEVRWIDIARVEGVVLFLVYTLRGDLVRCISYRPAKRKERRIYDAAIEDR